MQSTRLRFTYRDYLLLPEGDRRELIEGDFYVVPAPSFRHQIVSRNLGTLLWDFVRGKDLGEVVWAPTDVVLSPESVVQPDILFISNERRGIITEDNVSGAPDLVVEILSPSTADRDRELKLTLYARYGVREYWIVDPEDSSVEVMALEEAGVESARRYTTGRVESPVLPGLGIALAEIFASD
jgi:Uma2 family endonuclease